MATGYTSKLHDGEQSFSDFVLDCARAFGAYVHLRDNLNTVTLQIEDRTSTYAGYVDKSQTAYDNFTALTEDEQRQQYNKYVADMTKYYSDQKVKDAELAKRYGEMLGRVIAWNVPKELNNLKEFMKEQLERSIEFDCKTYNFNAPTFEEWLDDKVSYLERSLRNDVESLEKEKKRITEARAWHEALLKAAQQF